MGVIGVITKSIQKEYGWKSGLTIAGNKIIRWPYDAPLPSDDELAALVVKWSPTIQWEAQMQQSDSIMPRWFEDHLTESHGGNAGNGKQKEKYDLKVTMRAQKPNVN